MGVGKTTVSKELKNRLQKSVFLDGDWCWDMNPFVVNDETKAMVMDNYLRSTAVLRRSIERIHLYEKLDTVKIDVSEKTVTETVNKIMQLK